MHAFLLAAAALFIVATDLFAASPITNPVPVPVTKSGVAVGIEPWITIPASGSGTPKARINHMKPTTDGSGRLFCNDLRGKLWLISSTSASSASLFLNLGATIDALPGRDFIDSPGFGTGFTSFDFHPEFASNGKFYTAHVETTVSGTANYAGPVSGAPQQHGVITEWTMTSPADNFFSGTHRELLRIAFPDNIHCLQEISFNPFASQSDADYGLLYICIGDGGSVNINLPTNPGRIDSPLGTILRIAPMLTSSHDAADFSLSSNGNYYIPKANPFFGADDPTPGDGFPVIEEIAMYGFRNPHHISWDSAGSGKVMIGDIGESNLEEINLAYLGGNYGWPDREGTFAFNPADRNHVYPLPDPDSAGYRYPVAQYDHGEGFSVAGGFVYRGAGVPTLEGLYLFGDVLNGRVFYCTESNLIDGSQETVRELTFKVGGIDTSLAALVGNSRVDLRWGRDSDNEIYVLSKSNGVIYKLVEDQSTGGQVSEGDVEDWTAAMDFQEGLTGLISAQISGQGSITVVHDPFGADCTSVLRLQPSGTTNIQDIAFPVPAVADGAVGTLYFRFAYEGISHHVNFGLSDFVNPVSAPNYTNFEAQLRSQSLAPGDLDVRNAGVFSTVADNTIESNTWYELWMVINNAPGTASDSFNVYILGGQYTSQRLLASGVRFRNGTNFALQSFYIRQEGGQGTSAVYFDDILVDPDAINLTSIRQDSWVLVEDFEGISPLTRWTIPNASNQVNEVRTDPGGNHYLARRAASVTENLQAIAAKELPLPVLVGSTATVYMQLGVESTDLYQTIGVSGAGIADLTTLGEAAYEPAVRILGNGPATGALEVFDDTDYIHPITPSTQAPIEPLQALEFYEVWIVLDNGGEASQGQTYDVYIRGGSEFPNRTKLADNAYFVAQSEGTITHFLTIGGTGGGGVFGNGELYLDEIYMHVGEVLGSPFDPTFVPAEIHSTTNGVVLTITALPDHHYQTIASDDLIVWYNLGDVITNESGPLQIHDSLTGVERRFYRIVMLPCENQAK